MQKINLKRSHTCIAVVELDDLENQGTLNRMVTSIRGYRITDLMLPDVLAADRKNHDRVLHALGPYIFEGGVLKSRTHYYTT